MLLLFIACMQPYSIGIDGQGITANYLFLLIPFIFWLTGIKRRLVFRKEMVQILLIYSLIYIIGLPWDMHELGLNTDNPIRRLASFLVFIFPLLLSLIEFKPGDIEIFKKSVVLASLLNSVRLILSFFSVAGSLGIIEMKGAFGSQRYGFILCLGFFISLFSGKLILKKWILLQRLFLCSMILIGSILTLSRSTIVSLIVGVIFFFISKLFTRNRYTDLKIKSVYLIASLVIIAAAFTTFQYYADVNILFFYQHQLITPLLNSTLLNETVGNAESSEGFRYYVLKLIFDYFMIHPLFGSHFQGLYLIFDEFKEGMSTHNQYTDILLRTGLLGGALWFFLLYKIMRFCKRDKGLQVGLVAILIYGFFHETFKLSQGAFIFGMLLSFSYIKTSLKPEGQISMLTPASSKLLLS